MIEEEIPNIPDMVSESDESDEETKKSEESQTTDRLARLLDSDGVLRIKSIHRRTIPIEVPMNADGTDVKQLLLIQMSGDERGAYLEEQSKLAIVGKKGEFLGMKPGTVRKSDIDLISRHLVYPPYVLGTPIKWVDKTGDKIKTWSSEAIDILARACEELSCLGLAMSRRMKEADDEAKKD